MQEEKEVENLPPPALAVLDCFGSSEDAAYEGQLPTKSGIPDDAWVLPELSDC